MTRLPMFPLSQVHFPHVFLPLQVFEPRYRDLTLDCLDGDREFGVVLIERGSEVGGGDLRFNVGTVTSIVDVGFNAQGMVRLDTVGVRRIMVLRWLEDDPYPIAEVDDVAVPVMGAGEVEKMAEAEKLVRRALALRQELNEPAVPFDVVLDEDPSRAMFQLAAIAPLGPADKQRVLGAVSPDEFLTVLAELTSDELMFLAQRLAGN